jgi:hypothetical protein
MSGQFRRLFSAEPFIVASPFRSSATWSMVVAAAAKGPLLLELRNTPFSEGRSAATAAALAALAQAEQLVPFTAEPQQAGEPLLRVAIAFHPCVNFTPSALLRGQLRTLPSRGGLTLLAVLGHGSEVLASVEGRMEGVTSSGHAGFPSLLRQAVAALLGKPPQSSGD